MNSLEIVLSFTIALAAASFTSQTINGPHQAIAKSASSITKSLIGNITRFGVITTPIMCVTLGDVMKSLPSILNATAATTGGNETNSTQGMMMNMMEQGMMKSGLQNASQGELQHLKNFMFCSPANEKMMRSMMK
jgi:ABC-type sulfate transport system permease component